MGKFDGLFHPRGIAVIGASANPARPGGALVRLQLSSGYAGRIYPVNPRYDEVAGVRCYQSVRDIEGDCDLAVLAVQAAASADAVRDCGARGIPFAVVYGGGFRETGSKGAAHERALIEAARAGGVRLIGPNCLGIMNVPDRVYGAFGPMMREPRIAAGPVSLVSQSGGFGYTLALECAAAGAGLRYIATSGNEADLKTPELIDYFLDDPATRIVISYIEGVSDGRALMELGHKAAALGKPLLVWKAGRREQGSRAAASHTAAMTGRYEIYHAALEQSGIIEVGSIDQTVDLVRVLTSGRTARGRGIGLTGGSGGAAIVFADACDELGLQIPALSQATVDALRAYVPGVSTRGNPVDYVGGWLDDPNVDNFANVVRLLLADDRVDQVCIMFSTAQGKPALNGARILAEATQRSDKPILIFSSAPRHTMEEVLAIFDAARIPVMPSPGRVASAAAAAADYHAKRQRLAARVGSGGGQPYARPAGGERRVLDEVQSKALLARYGIPVTHDLFLPQGRSAAGAGIKYPVAVKVVSRDLPHKSDVGGVRLNIANQRELDDAIKVIAASVARAAPSAQIEGMLASEMVPDAIEVILGVVNDEVFGPTVLFGLGGTLAEVIRDVVYRVAPFDVGTAREMIQSLRGSALFAGVRGRPPSDIDALAQTISRVSHAAWELRASLLELDVNPLFVRQAGAGVVIGDALAVTGA